jgi:hypothetical protein
LRTETNPIVLEQLRNMKYTRDAIDTLKTVCGTFQKVLFRAAVRSVKDNIDALKKPVTTNVSSRLPKQSLQQSVHKQSIQQQQQQQPKELQICFKANRAIMEGDEICKINFGNGSKSTRWFQVTETGDLRWASKQKDIMSRNSYKSGKEINNL